MLVEAALVLAVAVASVLVLREPMAAQRFTIDESRWINASRYFWITFIDHDLFGPEWQPNYVVMTHPPVARYLIGFGLWLQGWSPDRLNGRYDSLRPFSANFRDGNIPTPQLLRDARRTTFPYAVGGMVLIYVTGRMLGGRLAGLAAAAFGLTNPLLTTLWTRALAESIVAFFSLLALAIALYVLPRLNCALSTPWLPVVSGASLALASASKLSGGIAVVGLAVFALVQQGMAYVRTRRTAGLRSWIDLGLAACIVFILVNPLLYPSPAGRTLALLKQRQDEMEFQQDVFERQAVPDDLGSRATRVLTRVAVTYATPRGSLPISPEVPFVVAGMVVVAVWAGLDLRRWHAGRPLLFVLWTAGFYAVITVNLGFDSAHYYAPLVTANAVLAGLAVAALADLVRKSGRGLNWPRRSLAQNTQLPVR